jgi:hypothetical protein
MMFCTNCGASNKEDAKFCVNCGESLSEVQGKEKVLPARELKDMSLLKKVSFLQTLFDFSFNEFATAKLIKLLYGVSILSAGLMALLFIIVGFNTSTGFGIFALLIGAPLIFLLAVISSRVILEMILAISHIAQRTTDKAERPESKDSIQWNV